MNAIDQGTADEQIESSDTLNVADADLSIDDLRAVALDVAFDLARAVKAGDDGEPLPDGLTREIVVLADEVLQLIAEIDSANGVCVCWAKQQPPGFDANGPAKAGDHK